MRPRRLLTAIAALSLAALPAVAPAAAPVNIYGIDDANNIWEIDPVAKQFTDVNSTGISGLSNSMAYDTARDQFFFTNAASSSLRFWDRQSTGPGSVPAIASFAQAGVTGDPANAAYYDNAYWYLTGGASRVLHKVSFSYLGNTPVFASDTPYDLTITGYPGSLSYGDIAINTRTGTLYGTSTSGVFYRLDLTRLGSPGAYAQIRTGLPSLQISFDGSYSTLFAHNYNDGRWYTLDVGTGALDSLDFATTPAAGRGFRDLGGASTTDAGSSCSIAPPGNSDDQYAQVGRAVKNPPSVRITGADGAPQAGVEITFSVTAGGGTLGGATSVVVTTNSDGVATAPTWVVGPSAGRNTVLADNVGTACSLTFSAIATVGPPPDPDDEDKKPQKPLRPVVLPDALRDPGTTTIAELPIRTNAGQVARARVVCTVTATGRPASPSRCRGFVSRNRLKVRVQCGRPLTVRVLITAPSTGDYKRYRVSRVYRTAGACAVTG